MKELIAIICLLFCLTTNTVCAAGTEGSDDMSFRKRISILAGYMPGWAGSFADGEPNYHWVMVGLKYKFTKKVAFSASTAVYQNGDEWIGPDLWPFRYELHYNVLDDPWWNISIGSHLIQYAVTDLNDWIEVSGSDVFYAYGLCVELSRLVGAGIKINVQGSLDAEGSKEWKRQNPDKYYDPKNSTTDFSGFNVYGALEISF